MREGNNKICAICGKVCRPGGIGAHMRLKHGIKVKTLVKHISGHRSDVSDISGHISDLSDLSDLSGVQPPGDYVKKRSEVIKTYIEPEEKRNGHLEYLDSLAEEKWEESLNVDGEGNLNVDVRPSLPVWEVLASDAGIDKGPDEIDTGRFRLVKSRFYDSYDIYPKDN